MMKTKDVKVATALVLQGYLRANAGGDNDTALGDALKAIRQECDDWSENLEDKKDQSAQEPKQVDVEIYTGAARLSRTPYNLVSGAIALLQEAKDLSGPEDVMRDLNARLGFSVAEDTTA